MVTLEQVQNGIARYIAGELVPHLTGMKRIGLAAYSALASQNIANMIRKYKDHPMVSMMDVINEAGEVDVDKLYSVLDPLFLEKQTVSIPMIGDFTLDHTDLEKLYRYIKG